MNDDFLHGPIAGKLFRFAMPIAFTFIFEQLVNSTDVFILGQFVSETAMAAVGNDGPVLSLLISMLIGLSIATNVTIAQYIGGRKYDLARAAEHTAILFSFLIGVGVMLLGELLTVPLLSLLAVPPEVYSEAEIYLRVFFLALPFLSLYNFEAAIFRAMGESKVPLYSLILAAVINLVLDLVAVSVGFGLVGVVGATVVAYMVDAGVLFFLLKKKQGTFHLALHDLQIKSSELKQIVNIGVPAGLQGMVFAISNLLIQSAINSLGAEVMAASAAAFVVETNVFAFVTGFGQATTTFVGQNFGALQIYRCFLVTRKALLVEIGFVASIGAVCCIFAEPIMRLFTNNPEIIHYGVIRIYLVSGLQFINGVLDTISGALRGYGYSLPPALVVLFGVCGTRIIWVFTAFAAFPTFMTIMICYPVSWLVAAAMLAYVYRAQRQRIFNTYATRIREELYGEIDQYRNTLKK